MYLLHLAILSAHCLAISSSQYSFPPAVPEQNHSNRPETKITGRLAPWNGWEFLVSMVEYPEKTTIGSGVLLSSEWALSTCLLLLAVKIFVENPTLKALGGMRIVAGSRFNENEKLGQWREPVEVILHPHCSLTTAYFIYAGAIFDYAVIKADRHFILNSQVKLVRLPSIDKTRLEYFTIYKLENEGKCKVAGWGENPDGRKKSPSVLYESKNQILNWKSCDEKLCSSHASKHGLCSSSVMMTGKICAQSVNGAPRKWNLGSPLVCDNYVVAILSRVDSVHKADVTNCYARLDVALKFIKKFLDVENLNLSIRPSAAFSLTILTAIAIVK